MKKYITRKRVIVLMIFLCLVQFWRIKDVGGVVKSLSLKSECYQNDSIISDYSKERHIELDILKFYDEQNYKQVKEWLKKRKVFACTGWNGFRTAVFIADENNNLIYYDRDTSIFTRESVPENFGNNYIDEESVEWGGRGDGGAEAPLHPNILQRIDAKIIQWTAKLFY